MEKHPIYLDRNTSAFIHIFTRPDDLEELSWMTDSDLFNLNEEELAKDAARQFIDQLQERWTPRFLMALREEINRRLKFT